VASRLIEEDEPRRDEDNLPPPPATRLVLKSHPRAPYLGLVVSEAPTPSAFEAGDFLQNMFERLWSAANTSEQPRFGV